MPRAPCGGPACVVAAAAARGVCPTWAGQGRRFWCGSKTASRTQAWRTSGQCENSFFPTPCPRRSCRRGAAPGQGAVGSKARGNGGACPKTLAIEALLRTAGKWAIWAGAVKKLACALNLGKKWAGRHRLLGLGEVPPRRLSVPVEFVAAAALMAVVPVRNRLVNVLGAH